MSSVYEIATRELGKILELAKSGLKTIQTVVNVSGYGAVGNGIADDTTSIINAVTDLQEAGGGILVFPPGTYRVFTASYSSILPTVPLIGLTGCNGVHIIGYGATIFADRTFGYREYVDIVRLTDSSNVVVEGLSSKSAEQPALNRERGQRHVRMLGGCRNISVRNCNVTGGVGLLATSTSTDDDTDRTIGVIAENLKFKSVAYGINFQFSGDQLMARGILSDKPHRTYFVYGVKDHDVMINSRNQDADDCIIGTYEGRGCENVRLVYTNTDSTSAENAAPGVSLTMGDETAATHRNIDIKLNVTYQSTGYFSDALNIKKYDNAGGYDGTDRGHTLENITISGTVQGAPPTTAAPIVLNGTWGAGENMRNWTFRDLTFIGTNGGFIKVPSLKDRCLVQNVVATNSDIYISGNQNGRISVVNCKAQNLCANPDDTSFMNYVNCEMTQGNQQSYSNKTFDNCFIGGKSINSKVNQALAQSVYRAAKVLSGDLTGTNNIFKVRHLASGAVYRLKYYVTSDQSDFDTLTRDETYGIKTWSSTMSDTGTFQLMMPVVDEITERTKGTASVITVSQVNGSAAEGGHIAVNCTNYNGANAKGVFELEVIGQAVTSVEAV